MYLYHEASPFCWKSESSARRARIGFHLDGTWVLNPIFYACKYACKIGMSFGWLKSNMGIFMQVFLVHWHG